MLASTRDTPSSLVQTSPPLDEGESAEYAVVEEGSEEIPIPPEFYQPKPFADTDPAEVHIDLY